MGFGWCLVISFLVRGLFGITPTIQYASTGQDVLISCPGGNVNIWQKLRNGIHDVKVLVLCGNRTNLISNSILGKISVNDPCNKLTIHNFTKADVGIYNCYTNEVHMGHFKKYNVEVKLGSKPDKPRNFQVFVLNTEIIVKWRAGNGSGLQQTFFIEYRKHRQLEWNVVASENKTFIIIDGLQMGTVYLVRVFSKTILGKSERTAEIIVKTNNLTDTSTHLFEHVEESVTANHPSKNNRDDGPLYREIVIYSLVGVCIIVILGLSYIVQKNRKKTKKENHISITLQSTSSNERHLSNNPDLSIYNEIDETMILDNVSMVLNNNGRNAKKRIHTDNTIYLDAVKSDDEDSSSSVHANSYLSFHESDQYYDSGGSNGGDDTASYLHPYHSVDEHWKEKTHQYDVLNLESKDTDDSSDSSSNIINDGYLNPYQPLKEGWKLTSHNYEASVTIHPVESLSTSSKQDPADEMQLITDTHLIPLIEETNEISERINNNLVTSKELKNKSNEYVHEAPTTHRENELVAIGVNEVGYSENDSHNCNYIAIKGIIITQSESNANEQDYTDAKSH